MIRSLCLAASALSLICATQAAAQSSSNTRTTTTTTVEREGNTTRTTTTTRSRSTGVSVDTDRAIGALIGAIGRAAAAPPPNPAAEAIRRRAEAARAEDAFGVWLADDGGRDTESCRFDFGQRGFLGMRSVSTPGCPDRYRRIGNYSVSNGELVLWTDGGSQEWGRLIYVDGRFLGNGLTLLREGDNADGPWAQELLDGRAPGGGYARPSEAEYAGSWRHVYDWNGMRRECTVSLSTNPAGGALGASQSGCFNGLMFTSSWRLEDGQVVLYRASGGTVAILNGWGDRLMGETPDGAEIVLYR